MAFPLQVQRGRKQWKAVESYWSRISWGKKTTTSTMCINILSKFQVFFWGWLLYTWNREHSSSCLFWSFAFLWVLTGSWNYSWILKKCICDTGLSTFERSKHGCLPIPDSEICFSERFYVVILVWLLFFFKLPVLISLYMCVTVRVANSIIFEVTASKAFSCCKNSHTHLY